jgi:hypothetical protein
MTIILIYSLSGRLLLLRIGPGEKGRVMEMEGLCRPGQASICQDENWKGSI